jgi:methanogenic corrinoid protein MtbC1
MVVIGTVQGDLHELGKTHVGTMLEASGFEVEDLGADVEHDDFVKAVLDLRAHLVCVSALLTTTMVGVSGLIEALRKAGVRDSVKLLVGGAPVTDRWAREIGADGYGADAMGGVKAARRLLKSP